MIETCDDVALWREMSVRNGQHRVSSARAEKGKKGKRDRSAGQLECVWRKGRPQIRPHTHILCDERPDRGVKAGCICLISAMRQLDRIRGEEGERRAGWSVVSLMLTLGGPAQSHSGAERRSGGAVAAADRRASRSLIGHGRKALAQVGLSVAVTSCPSFLYVAISHK